MRILHISSARDYGGGERHLTDLTRGLYERGHEVFVVLRPTNTWQEHLGFLPPERIMHASIRNSFGILSSKRIAAFARENGVEVIHAHVARDYIPASLAAALSKQAKFVLTRHVLFDLKPFNRYALKNLSKAIAVSLGVEVSLRRIFPKEKIELIPNGLDMTPLLPEQKQHLREDFRSFHAIPQDAPLVGILGELIELKGQREFVIAASEVIKEFPAARFVVVGKDNSLDQHYRREIKRLASTLGIDNSVLWLDWLNDTRPFYSAIDLFVSASHTESFGLAILEAMASGNAVIATETAGARELLGNNELLVPIDDPVALASGIKKMLGDSEFRRSVGESLAARAAKNYSAERMINATETLYKQILSEARS